MMKPVESSSIASPNPSAAPGNPEPCRRRSSPIATSQVSATTPNASMNILSAAGCIRRHRHAHALGQQCGIGAGKPQPAGNAEHDHGAEEYPCRRPVQRAGRHEQQQRPSLRTRSDSAAVVLQSCGFPVLRAQHDRAVSGKLAASECRDTRQSGNVSGSAFRPVDRSAFPGRAEAAPGRPAGRRRRHRRHYRCWGRTDRAEGYRKPVVSAAGAVTLETLIDGILRAHCVRLWQGEANA